MQNLHQAEQGRVLLGKALAGMQFGPLAPRDHLIPEALTTGGPTLPCRGEQGDQPSGECFETSSNFRGPLWKLWLCRDGLLHTQWPLQGPGHSASTRFCLRNSSGLGSGRRGEPPLWTHHPLGRATVPVEVPGWLAEGCVSGLCVHAGDLTMQGGHRSLEVGVDPKDPPQVSCLGGGSLALGPRGLPPPSPGADQWRGQGRGRPPYQAAMALSPAPPSASSSPVNSSPRSLPSITRATTTRTSSPPPGTPS